MMSTHPYPADRAKSVDWAKGVLIAQDRYVILDTETTGLEPTDEVIQLSVLGVDGVALLDTYIKPLFRKTIPAAATAIHHITMAMLANAPSFMEIAPQLKQIVADRTVLCYNADYDRRLLMQTARLYNAEFIGGQWHCAMKEYARYRGDWDSRKRSYRWPRLPSGDHSALGDCRATLAIIEGMARA